MQAQKEAPPDMQCKDKFLLQSVTVSPGTTPKDITPDLFSRDSNAVNECKLRVVYLPSTSAVAKGPEQVLPSNGLGVHKGNSRGIEASRTNADSNDKSSEARALILKLTEEKNAAIAQTKRIHMELDLLRRGSNRKQGGGASLMFVIVVGLIG